MRAGPKSATFKEAVTLSSSEAMAVRPGAPTRKHLVRLNVSSQVSCIGVSLECGCPVTRVEVRSLSGVPCLGFLPRRDPPKGSSGVPMLTLLPTPHTVTPKLSMHSEGKGSVYFFPFL